jgi:hypothetical protein
MAEMSIEQNAAQDELPEEREIKLGPIDITAKYPEVNTFQDRQVPDFLGRAYKILAGPSAQLPQGVAALDGARKRWLLYAMLLLANNRGGAKTFDYATAANWLANNAASLDPLYEPRASNNAFELQVLGRTGWLFAALSAAVAPLDEPTRNKISPLYSLPGYQPKALDKAVLQGITPLLQKALIDQGRMWFGQRDPQPIEDLWFIADFIQAATWQAFQPYAAARADSPFVTGLRYRDVLYDKTAAVPADGQIIGYAMNRAIVVGSDSTSGASLLVQAGYDAARPEDRAALQQILTAWLDEAETRRGLVAFLVRHTASNSHGMGKIGMVTEFPPSLAKSTYRWLQIRTLIHELMHSLIHPYLVAKAMKMQSPQVIGEGVIEVMTRELYNRLVARITPGAAARLQLGISQQEQAIPTATEAGYGQAGKAAAGIFDLAGAQRFFTAFFTGATDLIAVSA